MAQQEKQPGIGISVAQVIAGALASVSAAVVASFFGVAGTLIGAATTSVVATVGSALYKSSIERTQARVVRSRWTPQASVGLENVEETATTTPPWRIRWRAVFGGLAVVLALTFGTVTAVEVLAQKPLAAVVQQEPPQEGQTSLGAVVQEVTDTAPPTPTVPAEPTVEATGTAEPTEEVAQTATATGATGHTPTPAKKTPTPTPEPKTDEPTRVAPSGAPKQGTPTQP